MKKDFALPAIITFSVVVIIGMMLAVSATSSRPEIKPHTLLAAAPRGSITVVGNYDGIESCSIALAKIEEPWLEDVFMAKAVIMDLRSRPATIDAEATITWRPFGKCIPSK